MNTKLSTLPAFGWETGSWNASGCKLEREINFNAKTQVIAELQAKIQGCKQAQSPYPFEGGVEDYAKRKAELGTSSAMIICVDLQMQITQLDAIQNCDEDNTHTRGIQVSRENLQNRLRDARKMMQDLEGDISSTETNSDPTDTNDDSSIGMSELLNQLAQDPGIKSLPSNFGAKSINELRKETPMSNIAVRNVQKIVAYFPLIGTIRGLAKLHEIYKYWPKASAGVENRNWHVFRAGIETLSLGFLLLIPDSLATLYGIRSKGQPINRIGVDRGSSVHLFGQSPSL